MVQRVALIKMIFVLQNTILANKGSMSTAEVIGKGIRMIFAKYLEYILSWREHFFDLLIYLERKLLLSVMIAVAIAMAVCTFKVIFLGYTLFSILRRFNHLSFHASFASIYSAAKHNNRLSWCKVESHFAFKTFHKTLWHFYNS